MIKWCKPILTLIIFLSLKSHTTKTFQSILLMWCYKINTHMIKKQKEIDILIWKSKLKSKNHMNFHLLQISSMVGDNLSIHSQLDMEWNTLLMKNYQQLFIVWIKLKKHLLNDFLSFIFLLLVYFLEISSYRKAK